ncbi:MAG: hypothetical protein ACW99Q_19650 [Candidatus Kariarchaeaceae archaeon]|jgi:hypothetical protein
MVIDSEMKLTLQRIENALQSVLEMRDFRNFMLAKAYIEEGQVQTAMQFLNRIDRETDYKAQLVISQSLFIRALILVYNLQYTDALALLVRIKLMTFEKDEQLMKDITKLINDVKVQQQASSIYDITESSDDVQAFKQTTMESLISYLESARLLLKK